MTKHATYINTIIDKALEFSDEYLCGLQAPDVWVPQEMVDKTRNSGYNGIVYWKPLPANISDNEFQAFSSKIGYRLPETYKSFLSYKYFIELNFGHEAEIFPHTPRFIEDYFTNLCDTDKKGTLQEG